MKLEVDALPTDSRTGQPAQGLTAYRIQVKNGLLHVKTGKWLYMIPLCHVESITAESFETQVTHVKLKTAPSVSARKDQMDYFDKKELKSTRAEREYTPTKR